MTMESNSLRRETAEGTQCAWHGRSAEWALQELKATPAGLSQAAAAARLQTCGANRLPTAKKRSVIARFLTQFRNLLIYVLFGSAVITAFLDHLVDTLVILAVVIANAILAQGARQAVEASFVRSGPPPGRWRGGPGRRLSSWRA